MNRPQVGAAPIGHGVATVALAALVVACGGDGTLLRAARLVGSRDVPEDA